MGRMWIGWTLRGRSYVYGRRWRTILGLPLRVYSCSGPAWGSVGSEGTSLQSDASRHCLAAVSSQYRSWDLGFCFPAISPLRVLGHIGRDVSVMNI